MSDRESYLCFLLEGMPRFRNVGRLDIWESAYQSVSELHNQSKTEALLEKVFELGRFNLYGAFDTDGTMHYFEELGQQFAKHGYELPSNCDLSEF